MLSGNEIRRRFLDFFVARDHLIRPSSSLIPPSGSGLLWTSAGVVQFMPFMEGRADPPHTRLTSAQKCMRTTDIENVGVTARHLTFFEMLGNFSVGDYFKEEAIAWAWEFLLEKMGLDPGDLWVSVYREDDEAHDIWAGEVGVPEERIVRLGRDDNFWEVGIGPCGPCSEVFFDRGPEAGCDGEDCEPGCDCDRFSEIWNLVFTQYNRRKDGSYDPLPRKNIDTGMGLERITCVMQGKENVFETDLFRPIIEEIESVLPDEGRSDVREMGLKVIADHLRSVTFSVGDGVLPSNEGRGYVIRRLLRRAARYGHLLGLKEPFMHRLTGSVVTHMSEAYPELEGQQGHIARVVGKEEERFSRTLDQGLEILREFMDRLRSEGEERIPGAQVFRLYDTYGFPRELTEEIAAEEGFELDMQGFKEEMQQQRLRAREARSDEGDRIRGLDALREILEEEGGGSEFIGYSTLTASTRVRGILVDGRRVQSLEPSGHGRAEGGEDGGGAEVILILDQTPFYAESGGQIGDRGLITWRDGRFEVTDTRSPVKGMICHHGRLIEGRLEEGMEVEARVAGDFRADTARNHTATHLLHRALKEVLGRHVNQSGSHVGADRLRFDFTHYEGLDEDELERVEECINERVLENLRVRTFTTSLEEARRMGALALFDESYGDEVRLVQIGDWSLELCGGTHIQSTGELGPVRIVGETGVASGIRRIEAVSGRAALERIREQERLLESVGRRLKAGTGELESRVDDLLQELRELTQENRNLQDRLARARTVELLNSTREVMGVNLLAARVENLDSDALRGMGDQLRQEIDSGLIILGSPDSESVRFIAMATEDLVERGIHAGRILNRVAQITGGGGGGRPDMAQAGGKAPERIDEALESAAGFLEEFLKKEPFGD